ncbi:aldo/keto reductase [Actinoalloteichus hymeniacidonis]|uniref:Oxidoreductase, aryl-alcohol dehydrogenase like protein n=1 Tax=Actinoalloteichus hymeniacidonis TaxID=340345 RepID=A0AAC9HKS7_9PSEU|nr:aldo/keto reductase [Actinoalloteichus hymeniacidonis]AOS61029.1 putative oxidoreductase, aryl-alcohol dehydrogenase like protein [Actinoalloteichus hymeniacidonis]MBB5910971.1 aryl-alcohol dehydrogenase-like predicted oxidoreductase [Actinoalloteichus hymeniacidonis]
MTTGAPRLVLGTMTFADTVSAADAERMLDTALDAGIVDVDTANGYAKGTTETLLAPLIAPRRDRIRLATKAGMPHPDAGENSPLSPAGLRASVDGSLRRLGVDHIDLFYLHQPDGAATFEDTMSTVRELVEAGKIRQLGVSNFAAWQIVELNRVADQVGAPRPVVAQQLYNLLARRIDEEYAAMAAATGLETMVYNPLGGGLLTGRHRFESEPGSGRFGDSVLAGMYKQRYWDAQLFEAIDALAEIAARAEVPLTELALRWLASRPVVDAVLLGASRIEHLTANIEALGKGPLPAELVAACDEVGARLRGPMPAYNR